MLIWFLNVHYLQINSKKLRHINSILFFGKKLYFFNQIYNSLIYFATIPSLISQIIYMDHV